MSENLLCSVGIIGAQQKEIKLELWCLWSLCVHSVFRCAHQNFTTIQHRARVFSEFCELINPEELWKNVKLWKMMLIQFCTLLKVSSFCWPLDFCSLALEYLFWWFNPTTSSSNGWVRRTAVFFYFLNFCVYSFNRNCFLKTMVKSSRCGRGHQSICFLKFIYSISQMRKNSWMAVPISSMSRRLDLTFIGMLENEIFEKKRWFIATTAIKINM